MDPTSIDDNDSSADHMDFDIISPHTPIEDMRIQQSAQQQHFISDSSDASDAEEENIDGSLHVNINVAQKAAVFDDLSTSGN
jgi:hypothetical protein